MFGLRRPAGAAVGVVDDAEYRALIARFEQITGCPVLANTSFNVRGEPIDRIPEDASACFMGKIEFLAAGTAFFTKRTESPARPRL